jgi:hypothetical protein
VRCALVPGQANLARNGLYGRLNGHDLADSWNLERMATSSLTEGAREQM